MTFSVACPIAAQVMVAVFCIKRLVCRQRHDNWPQIAIERGSVLAFGFAFVIAFESCGAINRPHAGLPSERQRWRTAYPSLPQVRQLPCA